MKRISSILALLCAVFLMGARGCEVSVTTDSGEYNVQDEGTTTIYNGTESTVYLPGCSVFSYEKQEEGKWKDMGPNVVCVWEGLVKPLLPDQTLSFPFSAKDVGTWRLRYTVAHDCEEGKPMSQANCESTESLYTSEYRVVDDPTGENCEASGGTIETAMCCESADDFPSTCLIGACGCAPDYSHEVAVCTCPDGMCFNGNECVAY